MKNDSKIKSFFKKIIGHHNIIQKEKNTYSIFQWYEQFKTSDHQVGLLDLRLLQLTYDLRTLKQELEGMVLWEDWSRRFLQHEGEEEDTPRWTPQALPRWGLIGPSSDLSFFLGYKSSLLGTLNRVLSRTVESMVGEVGWGVKSSAGRRQVRWACGPLCAQVTDAPWGGTVPKQLSTRLPAAQWVIHGAAERWKINEGNFRIRALITVPCVCFELEWEQQNKGRWRVFFCL